MAAINSRYTFASPLRQSFSLPFDVLIPSLINCASPELLQKLQKTCKYFLWKTNVIIVDVRAHSYKSQLAFITAKSSYQKLGEPFKCWYINSLQIHDHDFIQITKYLKNIYRCNLRRLSIWYVIIKFNEINLLLNGGKIEDLSLYHVNMRHEDETPVNIISILEKCPQLRMMCYCNKCEKFSSKTFIRLNQIQFKNKLEKIALYFPKIEGGKLDPSIVCEYFKRVLSSDAKNIKLFFLSGFSQKEFNNFKSAVKRIIGKSFANLAINYYEL